MTPTSRYLNQTAAVSVLGRGPLPGAADALEGESPMAAAPRMGAPGIEPGTSRV
jgi:hypothetical protein